jgi:hypothetical protein
MDEKLIQKHMASLKISREEAIQLIMDDKEIDRGAKMFELDPELEKGSKKARRAENKPRTEPTKRERKPKPEKAEICGAMMDGLRELGVTDFEVVNAEREFIFFKGDTKYKVTLACPRK